MIGVANKMQYSQADEPTSKVHVYDAKLERWKEMIAATMPLARAFPSMSVQLGLIVAGCLIF